MLTPLGPGVFLHTMGGGPFLPPSPLPISARAPAGDEHVTLSICCKGHAGWKPVAPCGLFAPSHRTAGIAKTATYVSFIKADSRARWMAHLCWSGQRQRPQPASSQPPPCCLHSAVPHRSDMLPMVQPLGDAHLVGVLTCASATNASDCTAVGLLPNHILPPLQISTMPSAALGLGLGLA